jgi:outer membrane protein assembly factor BamB
VPFTLEGKRCVAMLAATELAVVDLANGRKTASYEWKTRDNANCADPVIVGDAVFVTSGYNVGSALIRVSGGNAAVLWKKAYGCVYASPVMAGDYLYALVESGWMKADLACVSAKDGSVQWRQKDVGSGGLMLADGKLIVLSRSGDLILAEASPVAYTEIARATIFSVGACWNGPVLCNGRIYAKNEKGTLVCLDVRRELGATSRHVVRYWRAEGQSERRSKPPAAPSATGRPHAKPNFLSPFDVNVPHQGVSQIAPGAAQEAFHRHGGAVQDGGDVFVTFLLVLV